MHDNGGGRISGLELELENGMFELRRGEEFSAELDEDRALSFVRCGVWHIRAAGGENNVIRIPYGFEAAAVRIRLSGAALSVCDIKAVDISFRVSRGHLAAGIASARSISAELGMGSAVMTAAPSVSAFFECGSGTMKIALAGSPSDYRIRCEHGIGGVTAGGKSLARHETLGNGEKDVFIRCGMGRMELDFSGDTDDLT